MVEIVEVSPRDGLQNESQVIDTADKLKLVEQAIAMGARRIEVTSFVNPRKVPQMADAEALAALLPQRDDVTYIGLTLNQRGVDRLIAAGLDEAGAVCVSSDTFGMRNQGQTSLESVEEAKASVRKAQAAGLAGQITIAVAFGCPFEGEVAIDHVVELAKRAAEANPREIAIADTIGVADPAAVAEMVARVKEAVHPLPIRMHFHNTRGTGLANVWEAVRAGASTIDAALGGIGGCPFAPGAAGNVATEDVLYMLNRAGIETGLSVERTIAAAQWLDSIMERDLPAMVSRAPLFPPKAEGEGQYCGV